MDTVSDLIREGLSEAWCVERDERSIVGGVVSSEA